MTVPGSYEEARVDVPLDARLLEVAALVERALTLAGGRVLDRLELGPVRGHPYPAVLPSVRLEYEVPEELGGGRRALRVVAPQRVDGWSSIEVYGLGAASFAVKLHPLPRLRDLVTVAGRALAERPVSALTSNADVLAHAELVWRASDALVSLDLPSRTTLSLDRASGSSHAHEVPTELARAVYSFTRLLESSPDRRARPLAFVTALADGVPLEWLLRRHPATREEEP